MEYIRALHPSDYDDTDGRFTSAVFTRPKSDEKGISVFNCECAIAQSGSVCQHARLYYSRLTSEPPVLWILEDSHLLNNLRTAKGKAIEIKQTEGKQDRWCHYEIYGGSRGGYRSYAAQNAKPPNILICKDNVTVIASTSTLATLHQRYPRRTMKPEKKSENRPYPEREV